MTTTSKYCPDCREELSLDSFTRDARRKDGLSFYCRGCRIVRDEVSRRLRRGPAQSRSVPRDVEVSEGRKWCPECGEVKNFDGKKVSKRPDLLIKLVGRENVKPTQDGIFVECKLIDSDPTSKRLYCDNGISRTMV